MKARHLHRLAGIFIALTLATTSLLAQGWRSYNRTLVQNIQTTTPCLNQISGLTEEQSAKITALITKHQETMNKLRNERRSATDVTKKEEIRAEMITKTESHRNEVRSLLTKEQQEQYDQLFTQAGNSNIQGGNGYQQGNNNALGRASGNRGGRQGNRNSMYNKGRNSKYYGCARGNGCLGNGYQYRTNTNN